MKNSLKGTVLAWILGVVIVVLAGFYFYKNTGGGDWKSFSVNEYQFSYPSSWRSQIISKQSETQNQVVNFSDTTNKHIATLQCPIRETGYQAWNTSSEIRRLDTDNKKHGARLWMGESKDGKLRPLYIVFMYRNTFLDTRGNDDDYNHSCQLLYVGDSMDSDKTIAKTFKEIYNSVSVQ